MFKRVCLKETKEIKVVRRNTNQFLSILVRVPTLIRLSNLKTSLKGLKVFITQKIWQKVCAKSLYSSF